MIDKFLAELKGQLAKAEIEADDLVLAYEQAYKKYVSLGQSAFDIIRHFGEPSEIVNNYKLTGNIDLPDMDAEIAPDIPAYLADNSETETTTTSEALPNIAPTTKAGMIANDILFIGLGLLFALAGCIALLVVSIFMTAGSVVQMGAVWQLATKSEQIGGFFLAILAFLMSVLFYVIIVWIVKVVVKFMKRYVHDHRENWAKCA